MERKSFDDETLWDADEDESNRRRDPLRGSLGESSSQPDDPADPPRRGRRSNALVREESTE